MTTTKKIKSIVKQVIAYAKGDDAGALGEKIYRQASAELMSQIASLGGVTVKLEMKLEKAKENLKFVMINHGKLIDDHDNYSENLIKAKNEAKKVEIEIKAHEEKIQFFKETLAALEEEVDAE